MSLVFGVGLEFGVRLVFEVRLVFRVRLVFEVRLVFGVRLVFEVQHVAKRLVAFGRKYLKLNLCFLIGRKEVQRGFWVPTGDLLKGRGRSGPYRAVNILCLCYKN